MSATRRGDGSPRSLNAAGVAYVNNVIDALGWIHDLVDHAGSAHPVPVKGTPSRSPGHAFGVPRGQARDVTTPLNRRRTS